MGPGAPAAAARAHRVAGSVTKNGVVYQIYPRSFQDSDGDGVGDLAGHHARGSTTSRWLGVDALWLSPIYPSPLADFGYDVSDYTDVDPVFGTLADFDALLAAAHERGLKVLMDLVPCHTSIEHPWFREHPDWYIWADGDGRRTTGSSTFGGPAWTRDRRRALVPALLLSRAARPRLAQPRGRGGDAGRGPLLARARRRRLPPRRDRPAAEGPAAARRPARRASRSGCRCSRTRPTLATCHSRNAPDIGEALGGAARGRGRRAPGRRGLPAQRRAGALPRAPRRARSRSSCCTRRWDAELLRRRDRGVAARRPGAAWVLSNHDFGRLSDALRRRERARRRAAAADAARAPPSSTRATRSGRRDGPRREPPLDRVGRDRHRHPMQWDGSATRRLHQRHAVAAASSIRRRATSPTSATTPARCCSLYRDLIALRRELGGRLRAARRRATAWSRSARGEHHGRASTRRPSRAPRRRRATGAARRRRAAMRDGLLARACRSFVAMG